MENLENWLAEQPDVCALLIGLGREEVVPVELRDPVVEVTARDVARVEWVERNPWV